MKLIINKETKESVPIKDIISIDYSINRIIEFEFKEHEIKRNILVLCINTYDEIYQNLKSNIAPTCYFLDNLLIIKFENISRIYSLSSLPLDFINQVKSDKKIYLVGVNENTIDYSIIFDKIIGL